jgi:Putative restriction endonuclease
MGGSCRRCRRPPAAGEGIFRDPARAGRGGSFPGRSDEPDEGEASRLFSAGVRVVWVVDPALRRVLVHRSLTDVNVLNDRQILTEEELLPGFSVSVSDLFPE